MKALYISYDGMTDPLGQSQVIPYLKGLSAKGYKISIISCEKRDRFEKQKKAIKKTLYANNIDWHPVPYSKLPSVFSKQLNLSLINTKAERLCKNEKPDVIHCRSYMAALIGMKLKQKYGVKFIFDMRGFWADERIDGGIWNLNNILHKRIYHFFKRKEYEFLLHADKTICLTNAAKDEIHSWPALHKKKIPIRVIPCCADLELFNLKNIHPSEKEKLKHKLHIHRGDFILSYLGSIGTWYMLDEMLDFFKRLLIKKPEAKFLFITPDDKSIILQKAKEKHIAKEKIIIHSASRNEVPLYISLSDISVYFIKPLYSKKASSPTKLGEIMGLGVPVITNKGIGDSDRMVSGSGALINEFSDKEYDLVISQLDVLLNLDKSKIIAASEKHFSLEKGIELYAEAYKKLKEHS
jgi:glycosyltransferase involved in cell wall biosynthesis